jgi:pimeloyl-ACP methyl ester carboxylesterase
MREVHEIIKRLSFSDAEIEYCEHGDGEPLLLVHAGGFADWFVPMAASQMLNDFRVIRIRRAGYGTHAPKRPLTLQDHARHIRALAKHLDIKTLHLVGHSSGGLISLQVASDHPELTGSLVLLEPAPCGPLQVPAFDEIGQRFLGPAMGAFAADNLEGAFDTFMRGVCGDGHRKVIEQSLGTPAYEQAVRESRFFFRDEVPAAMQWKFEAAEAARIRQPVLIVEGGEGRKRGLLSQQVTERVMTLLPQAEFAMIEGVNHLMPLQDPDAVGRVIADFARRHPILRAGAGQFTA